MTDIVTIEEPSNDPSNDLSNDPSNDPSNEPREERKEEPSEEPSDNPRDWINRPPTDDEKEEYLRQSIGQVGELPKTSAWYNDSDDESDGGDDVPTLVLKRGNDNSLSSEEDSSEDDLPPLLVQCGQEDSSDSDLEEIDELDDQFEAISVETMLAPVKFLGHAPPYDTTRQRDFSVL